MVSGSFNRARTSMNKQPATEAREREIRSRYIASFDPRHDEWAKPNAVKKIAPDSAYRGAHFGNAVRAAAECHASLPPACGGVMSRRPLHVSKRGTGPSIACGAGSRRSSAPGSVVMDYAECDGAGSPRPPYKFISPQSPTTSS